MCLRLWEERSHVHRPDFEQAEIQRVDLAAPVLQLWSWGETDVFAFPWFEPPSTSAVENALNVLIRLGAIERGTLTEIGKVLARLPVHPRIARLLIEGRRRGCAPRTAIAAALLSERDPFLRSGGSARGNERGPRTAANYISRSDVLDRVMALEEFVATGRADSTFGQINRSAAAFVLRARDQLLSEVSAAGTEIRSPGRTNGPSDSDAFLQSLLAAFPDRLAKRRDSSGGKGVMVGGRGVRLAPQCAVTDAELFLCIDVDAGQTEAIVRQASAIEREWLPAAKLRTADEVFFHPTQKSVVARRRTYWDDLVIDEVNVPVTLGESSAAVLAEAAWREWDRVFPKDDPELQSFLTRVRCLAAWMPELQLPAFKADQLRAILDEIALSCRSFDERTKREPHRSRV
jgi:ATP-dependent helicase HrpB